MTRRRRRMPRREAYSLFLTHRQSQNVVGGRQGKAEPPGVVAHSLEDEREDVSSSRSGLPSPLEQSNCSGCYPSKQENFGSLSSLTPFFTTYRLV